MPPCLINKNNDLEWKAVKCQKKLVTTKRERGLKNCHEFGEVWENLGYRVKKQ